MCKTHPRTSRFGSSLSHGRAHEADHQQWSRRDFLVRMGLGGAAASFMIGNTPIQAYANHSMFQSLRDIETDRVLVLIQLTGGNDGLNTIVPISNDVYYQNRPSISISSNDTIKLNNDFGLHPALSGFESIWGDGNLGIIHGVGYPDPTLSHFRSKDIWATGSGADDFLNTGWIGRALGETYPNYSLNPPDYPLVVQLGNASSVLMQGPVGPMGMNILSDSIFDRLADGGNIYDEDDVPNNVYGQELAFARTISNDSYEYAAVISDAMSGVSNSVSYPNNNELSDSMSQVARMIKGKLPTHIYLVNLGGFDTHTNQETRHGQLMEKLGGAMTAFYEDLQATGDADRVMMMTFSEFGRRLGENSSNGTDHGAAAPVIIMGNGVAGGFYGDESNLSNTSGGGNVEHTTDFRKVYSSVLRNWLGIEEQSVTNVFGGNFGAFAFIEGSTGDDGDPDAGDGGGGDNGDGGGGDNGDGGDGGDGGGGGDNGDGGDGGDGGGGDNGDGGDGGDGGNGGGGGGDNGDGGDGGDGGGGDNGDGGTSTGIGTENGLKFSLDQNYPNPFRGRTQIQFELPTTMRADITVYDMTGRQIEVLKKGTLQAGKHTVEFNANNLSSGVYMCRLSTPTGTIVRRMTILN